MQPTLIQRVLEADSFENDTRIYPGGMHSFALNNLGDNPIVIESILRDSLSSATVDSNQKLEISTVDKSIENIRVIAENSQVSVAIIRG